MVPYNLPNGKTIYLPADKILDLSDEDIQDFMAEDTGIFVEDPFMDSTIDDTIYQEDSEDTSAAESS